MDKLKVCGAVHPEYPNITCLRQSIDNDIFSCCFEWHLGIMEIKDCYGIIIKKEYIHWKVKDMIKG
jgi:hypothetical protein